VQLQKLEEQSSETLEFEHLKDHFENHLKSQSNLPSSTQPHPLSNNKITKAASEALKTSKLLKDLPSLANSKYLSGSSSSLSSRKIREKVEEGASKDSEELKPYDARTTWENGRVQRGGLGIIGRREENRREFVKNRMEKDLTSLDQRWENSWESPVKVR